MKCPRVLQPVALIACSILLPASSLVRTKRAKCKHNPPLCAWRSAFADQKCGFHKVPPYRVHVRPVMVANLNRYSPLAGSARGFPDANPFQGAVCRNRGSAGRTCHRTLSYPRPGSTLLTCPIWAAPVVNWRRKSSRFR